MVTQKSLFSWVLERCRGLQLLLIVMILFTVFFRVFPLEMQKRIVNVAIRSRDINALLTYCGLYISAVVTAGILKYVINVVQGYIGQKILYEMRDQLYAHILSLPLSFFRRTSPGLVISSLTSELSGPGDFLGSALAVPIINLLTLIMFVGYMIYLNPLLAVLSFAMYPLEILIIPVLQKRYNKLNQDRINVTRGMSNAIGEAISGMHEIHGNASYPIENRKLDGFGSKLFALRHRMNKNKYMVKFINNFFQSLGPFILFLVGGYLSIRGRLDLGALVAFLSAYEKLYDPWKELMDYYQDFQDSRVRYYQVMNYFDYSPEFQLKPDEAREPYLLKGKIEINDLDFVADGNNRILDRVSLGLQPGEQLGVVGLSGSGKSTLAMVIGQLYSYTRGHVLVDGMELKTLTKLDVSHNMGYVAQHPFIFDDSIKENILYSRKSLSLSGHDEGLPSRDEILRVIDEVGLTEDILRFGLNSVLERKVQIVLARKIVGIREEFYRRWGTQLVDDVEFFDVKRFLHYTNIAENISFGYPNRADCELEQLPSNRLFRRFLDEVGLTLPLLDLGQQLAKETVSLLEDIQDDQFFFEMSPIARDELEVYSAIVELLSKGGGEHLGRNEQDAILKLALRFTSSRHKMAALPSSLERQIIEARRLFFERFAAEDPGAFIFYHPDDYLYTHSLMDNILFGHLKADRPRATEEIQNHVVNLLHEQHLFAEVMEVGLSFQVGSKGDRLSGGQKQKIALARVLLKQPRILILDEATASLDNRSQTRIQELIKTELKGKSTLIAVVHRLELVKDYDQIIVMKAGKIVEMG
ncbi:MAG: ABC transporter ATP-binding protein/permease, partial [Desulforhabdus sp.]|nr:ABC transporter ATP-binding protein/permease [Desulforhabdus sp.]